MRRRGRLLVYAAGALTTCLGIAEAALRLQHRDAFPHLNVYLSDGRLGVRMQPGTSARLRAGKKSSVSSIRINRDGLRGADLPPPTEGEILMVGDAQVFGLGVEEHETTSSHLGHAAGGAHRVTNAGVPTYGPPEYNLVASDNLANRRIGTVVYVVNLVDDLFEAAHPNNQRHGVWEGWAVEKGSAPASVIAFPGRALLFRRSHLAYAVRPFLQRSGPRMDAPEAVSQAAIAALLAFAAEAAAEHQRANQETEARKAARQREVEETVARLRSAQRELERSATEAFGLSSIHVEVYRRSEDHPGDMDIQVPSSTFPSAVPREGPRGPAVTTTWRVNGAEERRRFEATFRWFADAAAQVDSGTWRGYEFPGGYLINGNPNLADEIRKGRSHPLVRALDQRDSLQKRVETLRAEPVEIVRAWSPLAGHLREVKAACDARGARLLVVVLPLDLQLASAGARPDQSTRLLVDDVVTSAEAIGALALDATPVLAPAGPAAFIEGTPYLSPGGHEAVAMAIGAKLNR